MPASRSPRKSSLRDWRAQTPLAPGIHVWRVRLSRSPDERDRVLLSDDERKRAERFVRDGERGAWVQSRAWWRRILGYYLGTSASTIQIMHGTFGAPRTHPFIQQSLSHTDGLALIAISLDDRRAVGIDVERLRILECAEVSRVMLSPAELLRFLELPVADRTAHLLRTWTRKEAWLKALGCGLHLSPDAFDVALESPGRISSTLLSREVSADWLTSELDVGADYVAAIACRGPLPNISQWPIESHDEFLSVTSRQNRPGSGALRAADLTGAVSVQSRSSQNNRHTRQ